MRRVRWIIPLVLVVMAACTDTNDSKLVAPVTVKTPDAVYEEAGTLARFYAARNPHTVQELERHATGIVCELFERFEASGYSYRPDQSFVADGHGPDGRPVQLAVFSLENVASPRKDATYLCRIASADGSRVVPLRITFNPGATSDAGDGAAESTDHACFDIESRAALDDRVQIADGVWLEILDWYDTGSGDDLQLAARFSWRNWAECVGRRLVAGVSSCALTCRITGVGYLHCLGICSGGHLVFAMIDCAFQQLA